MNHQIVWVDIPVTDLDRAIAFYSLVLGKPVTKEGGNGFTFGLLPHANTNVSGALYLPDDGNTPARMGPLVYLNATGRMKDAVQAVVDGGGTVIKDIHPIGPHGFRAIFIDTEGNRVALHAPTA